MLTETLSSWTVYSLVASLIIFTVATLVAVWKPIAFFAQLSALYATILLGRLFGTLHIGDSLAMAQQANDVLLVAETGPGKPYIVIVAYVLVAILATGLLRIAYQDVKGASVTNGVNSTLNEWALVFIRCYVGLMFIAHYSGHILAGPDQFAVFAEYFSGVGLGIGAPMVILAGFIEVAVSIGLSFGFMTRLASVGAALYLFFSTLWGAHFGVGYVWVLPTGGWEFPIFWLAMVLVFAIVGGGRFSLDAEIRKRGWFGQSMV